MMSDMADMTAAELETRLRQRNLKTAWAGRHEFTADEQILLYRLAKHEFGPDWLRIIQEP